MILKLILVLAGHLLVLAIEVPGIMRRRLWREGWVVLGIVVCNALINGLLAAGVQVPSPTDLLTALLEPLGKVLGG